MEVIAIDFVEQQPAGFDMTVSEVIPLTAERMIAKSGRERVACGKKRDYFAHLRHIFAALLRALQVAPKLRTGYRDSHIVKCRDP
jgi:hypothetical protein